MKVGAEMVVRGVRCRVTKVLPFGTVDVVSLCGRHAWRVSGYPGGIDAWLEEEKEA